MSEVVMKEILVMRHGDAAKRAATDAERPLTDKGKEEVAANAVHLPTDVDLFLASPYVRAQQTASIVADIAKIETPLETLELITPSGIPRHVDDWLQSREWQKVLLVSHQPFVGQFVEYLTEGSCYNFATAGIVRVTLEMIGRGMGRFEWLTQ